MSSNVGQNFPYASETEDERRAVIERTLGAFEGLREKVASETTPLGDLEPAEPGQPHLWWTFVCPVDDFRGRLHVAGYALERHALYTVCDTCGATFLR